jgi:hypothetical protein
MVPTWTAVVTALSLALIALAAIAVGVAALLSARAVRRLLNAVERVAGPALTDLRQLVGTIRTEADAIVGASRDVRLRIMRAADAAEHRLGELDSLVEVLQEEVQDAAIGVAATFRDARSGVRLLQWTRKLLSVPKDKKKRGRR